ncbi:hypothetical protein Hdeb2414_s0023g00637901 [Helianthus debilis subsp. tardiflorus]
MRHAAAAVPCSDGSLSPVSHSLQMGLLVMGLVVVGFDDGGGGGGGGGGAVVVADVVVVVAEVVVAGEKFLWCEVFGLGFVKMFEAKVLSFCFKMKEAICRSVLKKKTNSLQHLMSARLQT